MMYVPEQVGKRSGIPRTLVEALDTMEAVCVRVALVGSQQHINFHG
jgi:hypothetical protein